MHLEPNTYLGLTFGLTNFDGIETDLRLSKDNQIVIYHDPHLENGELIADLTVNQLEERGIPSFEQFLSIPEVVELSASKIMYLELKPNCDGNQRLTAEIADTFYSAFQSVMNRVEIDLQSIHIISFSHELLAPFVDSYPCYPLLPDVNECTQKWVVIKAMPQVLGRSLSKEIAEADQRGYKGVFFARQYVMGWTSWRHPGYEKAVAMAEERGMILGSNLGSPDKETEYPAFSRFSDKLSDYPRHAQVGEGPIIAHRGTGTKGVEVAAEDVPQLSI